MEQQQQQNSNKFVCEICKKECDSKESLKAHEIRHGNNAPHKKKLVFRNSDTGEFREPHDTFEVSLKTLYSECKALDLIVIELSRNRILIAFKNQLPDDMCSTMRAIMNIMAVHLEEKSSKRMINVFSGMHGMPDSSHWEDRKGYREKKYFDSDRRSFPRLGKEKDFSIVFHDVYKMTVQQLMDHVNNMESQFLLAWCYSGTTKYWCICV